MAINNIIAGDVLDVTLLNQIINETNVNSQKESKLQSFGQFYSGGPSYGGSVNNYLMYWGLPSNVGDNLLTYGGGVYTAVEDNIIVNITSRQNSNASGVNSWVEITKSGVVQKHYGNIVAAGGHPMMLNFTVRLNTGDTFVLKALNFQSTGANIYGVITKGIE